MTNKRLSIGLLMTLVVSMAIAPALTSQNVYADNIVIFEDDFNTADTTTIPNGWLEYSPSGSADASISGNRLNFESNDQNREACVTHTFSDIDEDTGFYGLTYLFDNDRTGSEGQYAKYFQLGEDLTCTGASQDDSDGVGVNLKWGGINAPGGMDTLNGFGTVKNGVATQYDTLDGEYEIGVIINTNNGKYRVFVDGSEITPGNGVLVDDIAIEKLNTIRIYSHEVNSSNFGDEQYDDIKIVQGFKPQKPTLEVVFTTSSEIEIIINPNDNCVDETATEPVSYNIYRQLNGGGFPLFDTIDAVDACGTTVGTDTATTLDVGDSVRYKVSAINSDETESDKSKRSDLYVVDIDEDAPLGNGHFFSFLNCDDEWATSSKAKPVITSLVPTIDGATVTWAQQELDADIQVWIFSIHVGCYYPEGFEITSNGGTVGEYNDDINSSGEFSITGLECDTNYNIGITGVWRTGAFGGELVDSETQSTKTLACEARGGGGNDEWKTAPTFGIDWNTKSQLVEEGVTFNRNSYDVDDNFHTDFAKQPVIVGVSNIVAMKVYAQYDLKWVELMFDVPETGAANEARATIFVPMTWMDTDEIDQDNVEVLQDVNLINADKVEVYRVPVTCTDDDVEENCDLIAAKVTFNEQPASGVFAFKAVDERNRSTTTYFNDGIEVLGESLNPLEVVLTTTPDKAHRGLVELTQVGDRYDNLWTSEDGYLYTMNSFGTFILVQAPDREARVDGGTPDRNHSAWDEVLNYEEAKAKSYWNADLNKSELPPSFAYEYPTEDSRTQFLSAHDMLSFARGTN